MPLYMSQHTLACLTRQGATALARQVLAATPIKAKRVLLNMQEGKMLIEMEAPDREEIEKWFKANRFHFDWLLHIEFESVDGDMHPV